MLNWLAIRAVASNHMAICYINTKRLARGGARAGVGAVVEPSTGKRQTRKARGTHRQSHPQAADRQTDTLTHTHACIVCVCACVYRQGLCTSDAIAKSQNAFLTFRA